MKRGKSFWPCVDDIIVQDKEEITEQVLRLAGSGTGPGILPGSDQEYLGHDPRERRLGRRTFTRDGNPGCDGPLLSRGIYRGRVGGASVVGEEGGGMDSVNLHIGRGCPKASAVCICRTAIVPPTGVGFCAEGIPWCGRGIRPDRRDPPGGFSPGSLSGNDGGPAGEAGGAGHPRSGTYGP